MYNTKVYLAGDVATDWRTEVINNCPNDFIFFNPQDHGLENDNPNLYMNWDLFYLDQSDILFGYMEKSNNSGYGLSLEIGFARAKNKLIILVDERSDEDAWFNQKFTFIREVANVSFNKLDVGITYLSKFGLHRI